MYVNRKRVRRTGGCLYPLSLIDVSERLGRERRWRRIGAAAGMSLSSDMQNLDGLRVVAAAEVSLREVPTISEFVQ